MTDTADISHALFRLSLIAGQMASKPHKVGYLTGYEPNRNDIREFQDQMVILAGALDGAFDAMGRQLESLGIIGAAERREYFTRSVMNAIEGQALYAIESGIEKRLEDHREAVGA